MKKIITGTAAVTAAGTLLFILLNSIYQRGVYLTLAISFGTTCYHFVMRLLVGAFVDRLDRGRWNYNNRWFCPKKFEDRLYNILRVKRWKGRMPSYEPKKFSREYYSLEEILQNMCVAEVCHEVIILCSFLPLLMAIPYGELPVFLGTSIIGAGFDALFVIMQRYNRPRLVRILKYDNRVQK